MSGVRAGEREGEFALSRRQALSLAAAATVSLGGCASPIPDLSYRYRLAIEANVGGVVRRASSVIQVRHYPAWYIDGDRGTEHYLGDAALLDVGGGDFICALLHRTQQGRYYRRGVIQWSRDPTRIFDRLITGAETTEFSSLGDVMRSHPGPYVLSPSNWPAVIYLSETAPGRRIAEINPYDPGSTLPRSVSDLRILLSITEDTPSRGIEKILPWVLPLRSNVEEAPGSPNDGGCGKAFCVGTQAFMERA